jgi:hypothetical protein
MEIANRIPKALVDVFIERVVNSAARRWAITGSTVRGRIRRIRQIGMRNEGVTGGDALVVNRFKRRDLSTATSCGEESREVGAVEENELARGRIIRIRN